MLCKVCGSILGAEPSVFSWCSQSQITRRKPPTSRISKPNSKKNANKTPNREEPHFTGPEELSARVEQHCFTTFVESTESQDEVLELPIGMELSTSFSKCSMKDAAVQTEDVRIYPVCLSEHSYTNNSGSSHLDVQTVCLDASTTNHWSDHEYSFIVEQKSIHEMQEKYNSKLIEQEEMLLQFKKKIGKLELELNEFKERQFTIEKYKGDDNAVLFYTGFPNYDSFIAFHKYLEPKLSKLQYWEGKNLPDHQPYQEKGKKKPGRKRKLTTITELFLVLVRLRVGLFVKDIADRFGISPGHVSKIFCTWINLLHYELKLLFPFPSQECIRMNMPLEFSRYPGTRIIIDCTEVFVETPSSMLAQSETWSNYKHHNTFKVLVGISPNGQVIFISDLWGGRVSDKHITEHSGLLAHLLPGDNVMADRGFDIESILPPGVKLNIPPFKGERAQLSAEEVIETHHIAAVRIHVERAIGRIKNYHILDGNLPLTLAHISTQIFTVCSYLTNFLPPLLVPKFVSAH